MFKKNSGYLSLGLGIILLAVGLVLLKTLSNPQGILLGLPAGVGLTYFFIAVLKDFPLTLSTKPLSYLLSCGVTLLFALAVNGLIGRRMREIDMLGALKSVE